VPEKTDSEQDFITSAYCSQNEIDRNIIITRPKSGTTFYIVSGTT